ncbi:hypothetical protein PF005_g24951 [Phytophthora fragariae]|uniref:Pectate lyase n=1 Tax=Phytophthora fragariae TaxID=53985 RepID=A0A6A3QH54_9STRA|nr:hypothetical protein PF003_g23232 [Phytophthora fragariae]KAE8926269.1 hypothetical protein PF009_g23537 [Phytophthora fragariae]KAE8970705.1 hypothetical protein PF011_g26319 [Phytophthora fragariae]KAE9074054.1 hypothetical protein PF010_g24830 [Phytophthora fragariae]KAE9075516.1 hypothetical protein PF007_g24974 [Phytophthora fragariae]
MIRSSIRAFVLPLVALAGLVTATEDTCGGPNARIEPPLGAIVVNSTGDYDGSYLTVSERCGELGRRHDGKADHLRDAGRLQGADACPCIGGRPSAAGFYVRRHVVRGQRGDHHPFFKVLYDTLYTVCRVQIQRLRSRRSKCTISCKCSIRRMLHVFRYASDTSPTL